MEQVRLITRSQSSYELLDSGFEEKLERFGDFILSRPDPQALWEKKLSTSTWKTAHARFVRSGREGKWIKSKDLPDQWQIEFGGLNVLIKPTSFKHTGLFPEQLLNWEWCAERIKNADKPVSVLNLFGYTGAATIAASKAGANVVHVDASKTAVLWARENAKISMIEDSSVQWIVEDVMKYVQREVNRGHKYDAIIMDPPAFGHGPQGELWKIEEHLMELISLCKKLISDSPLFIVLNGYAAGYSSLAFAYNLQAFVDTHGGSLEYGDLTIEESVEKRLLPCGIFSRWSK